MASRADILTDYGRVLMSWLPPALQESEDYMAVIHPLAMELERLEGRIELVRDQLFPQTATVLLPAWERLVRTAIEPVGSTVEERRMVVMALLSRSSGRLGEEWEERVTSVVGPGWSYEEHIPGDVTSPPEGTVLLTLPFEAGSPRLATAGRAIRAFTPAHLELSVVSAEGFRWDVSHWDEEAFGA